MAAACVIGWELADVAQLVCCGVVAEDGCGRGFVV